MTTTLDVPVPRTTWHRYIPNGFKGRPKSVLNVLRRTRAGFREEKQDIDRWLKEAWFSNKNPGLDPEDPFCNSWQACLAGMVAAVTVGARRNEQRYSTHYRDGKYVDDLVDIPKDEQVWLLGDDTEGADSRDEELYEATIDALVIAANDLSRESGNDDAEDEAASPFQVWAEWSDVPEFNDADATTRADVMKVIDRAILNNA